MSTKQIKGVIVPRHDIAKNWANAVNFIPRKGELIVFDADTETYDFTVTINGTDCRIKSSDKVRFKFGDGEPNAAGELVGTNVNALPFATSIPDDYNTDYVNNTFANALKSSVEGEELTITDTSPVTHDLKVKLRKKNLIPFPYYTQPDTIEGVTYSVNDDGSVTANGTSSADSTFYLIADTTDHSDAITLPAGTYTFKALSSEGISTTYYARVVVYEGDATNAENFDDLGNGCSFTLEQTAKVSILFRVKTGVTVENLTIYPQLEYATLQDVTVTRRCENLIPIAKWDEKTYNGVKIINNKDGTYTINGENSGVTSSFDIASVKFEKGKTYTLSGCMGGNNTNMYQLCVEHGNIIKLYNPTTPTPANMGKQTNEAFGSGLATVKFYVYAGYKAENIVIRPQLEISDTVTEPQIATANADGTVDGLTSISQTMILETNNPFVIIECEYNKDITAAFENTVGNITAAFENTVGNITAAFENTAGNKTSEGGEIFNLYEDTTESVGTFMGVNYGNQTVLKNEAGEYAHAEGFSTVALGKAAHSEGAGMFVTGAGSHGEGRGVRFDIIIESIDGSNIIVKPTIDMERKSTFGIKGLPSQEQLRAAEELNSIKRNAVIWYETDDVKHDGHFYYVTDAEPYEQEEVGIESLASYTYTKKYKLSLDKTDNLTANGTITVLMGSALSFISHTEGNFCNTVDIEATNLYSDSDSTKQRQHAEGSHTLAIGYASHTEGEYTTALGTCSHAEGVGAKAVGDHSHAEGDSTRAQGRAAHTEGRNTEASGDYSHTEGRSTTASNSDAHAEGFETEASGSQSHSEGHSTLASGAQSHAEGLETEASGSQSHSEGYNTEAAAEAAHSEGKGTKATGDYSHSEGKDTQAIAEAAHAEGAGAKAEGISSHAEGKFTAASGKYSHAEGHKSIATGYAAHAEGELTDDGIAAGKGSFGEASHTEGVNTLANKIGAHAEGGRTEATGDYSHAEGRTSKASGYTAHAEGDETTASASWSHAEGRKTKARHKYSHAEGLETVTGADYQHVCGYVNKPDDSAIFVVGNGDVTFPSGSDNYGIGERKNAFTVHNDGHAEVQTQGITHNSVVTAKYLHNFMYDNVTSTFSNYHELSECASALIQELHIIPYRNYYSPYIPEGYEEYGLSLSGAYTLNISGVPNTSDDLYIPISHPQNYPAGDYQITCELLAGGYVGATVCIKSNFSSWPDKGETAFGMSTMFTIETDEPTYYEASCVCLRVPRDSGTSATIRITITKDGDEIPDPTLSVYNSPSGDGAHQSVSIPGWFTAGDSIIVKDNKVKTTVNGITTDVTNTDYGRKLLNLYTYSPNTYISCLHCSTQVTYKVSTMPNFLSSRYITCGTMPPAENTTIDDACKIYIQYKE